ncbi:MAG: recombinase family protein, partial [Patescibacteria group bacterium]
LAKKEGLEIVAILEESMSAKQPGRPVFQELLDRLESGEADGIITWKLNRLSRNPIDNGKLSWLLQQRIIKHIRAYDRSYYPEDNQLILTLELGQANQEILDLSVGVKRGLRKKARMGHYPCYATNGYIHDPLVPKGKKYIIPDPNNFSLIQEAFELILSGKATAPEALRIATEEWGLRSRRGFKIQKSTWYRMLHDPFYAGYFEYPKGSGDWYDGVHEKMITREEYKALQTILSRPYKIRPKTRLFSYTGKIICGECGGMVTAEIKFKKLKDGTTKSYIYYHCTKRKNPNCSQKSITEEVLEEQLIEILEKIELPKGIGSWVIEQIEQLNTSYEEERNEWVHILESQIEEVNGKVSQLTDLVLSGTITEEELKAKRSELLEQRNRLEHTLQNKQAEPTVNMVRTKSLIGLAENITSRIRSGSVIEKKHLITQLCSNLTLFNKKLSVEVEKPFSIAEELAKEVATIKERLEPQKDRSESDLIAQSLSNSDAWLPRLDSNQ